MIKKILILTFVCVSLFAYADSDMDGVPNYLDKCPNTPITDLVGPNGCPIKSLVKKVHKKSVNHYDITIGANFGQSDYQLTPKANTYSSSLQVGFYHKAFSMQFSTQYYYTQSTNYNSSGMGDTTVSGYYAFHPTHTLTLQTGAGVILPTYESYLHNNKTDYLGSIFATYKPNKYSIFGGYTYTLINDTDVRGITYQNTNAFTAGAGYNFTPNFYTSLSYYEANSIYRGVENLQNVSLYMFYSINQHWFTIFSFAAGLNRATSQDYSSIKLGYYF